MVLFLPCFADFGPTSAGGMVSFGLQEIISRPDKPVLLGWTVKNTGALVKIHPGRISECFLEHFFVFLGVPV